MGLIESLGPKPPTAWQPHVKKGDRVLIQDVVNIYSEVQGRGTFKVARFMKAWSCMCTYGECGDTYIDRFSCLIDDDAWEWFKSHGWPESIDNNNHPFSVELRERDGVLFPYLTLTVEG